MVTRRRANRRSLRRREALREQSDKPALKTPIHVRIRTCPALHRGSPLRQKRSARLAIRRLTQRQRGHAAGRSAAPRTALWLLIQGLQDNIKQWLGPSGSQADLVLLLVGTNDIVFDSDLTNGGARTSKLLTTICNKDAGLLPKARVIVAQLQPLKPADRAMREVGYNAAVVQAVADHAKLGENVSIVDMHSALTLDDLYTDGEHPVDSGYIKMAKVWFDAITKP